MRVIRAMAAAGLSVGAVFNAVALPSRAPMQDSPPAGAQSQGPGQAAAPDGASASNLPAGQNLIEFVAKLKPSVLTLVVSDEDGVDVASGTAFFLDDNLVISNHQVASQGVKGRIALPNGQTVGIANVVAEMREVNLVLLEITATQHTDLSAIEPMSLASSPAAVDDEILMLSSAVDREHAVSKGRILNRATVGEAGEVLRSDLSYVPGSTGSPVLNGKAEVIGVAGFASVDGKQEKFIVPAERIMAMRVSAGSGSRMALTDYRAKYGPAAAAVNAEEAKLEATIVKQQDGTLLIDDKYVVRGAGTQEDPYRITWDLLYSAARVYKPREGKDKLPERITFLHDKWVELPGYLAFPLMTDSSAEVLLMLNQWDGCCIGVPPTPYDAVEVTLVEEVKVEGGLNIFNYGTVRGHMKVDPYVVNKWLVGLYLMDQATLSLDMK